MKKINKQQGIAIRKFVNRIVDFSKERNYNAAVWVSDFDAESISEIFNEGFENRITTLSTPYFTSVFIDCKSVEHLNANINETGLSNKIAEALEKVWLERF